MRLRTPSRITPEDQRLPFAPATGHLPLYCATVVQSVEGNSPSEEHLPIALKQGATAPQVGEVLYLLPRHICPAVNNFDCALVVRNGNIESVEAVSARGREAPLLQSSDRPLTLRG